MNEKQEWLKNSLDNIMNYIFFKNPKELPNLKSKKAARMILSELKELKKYSFGEKTLELIKEGL